MGIRVLVDVKGEIKRITGVDVDSDLSQYSDEQLSYAWRTAESLHKNYAQVAGTEKTFMNSIYGATGTKYFPFCNFNTAEDITGEGQFYILAGENIANTFLHDEWHLDTELHKHLVDTFGIEMFKFPENFTKQLPKQDYVNYIDTDSIYVRFDELINSIGYTGTITSIILEISKFRLASTFDTKLNEIVQKRNGEMFLKFDLEKTASLGFFLAKKKYLLAEEWNDKINVVYENPAEHLDGKGIEIARREFSSVAINMIKFILAKIVDGSLTADNYKAYMQSAYDVFCNIDLHECCKFVGLNKVEQYVEKQDITGWSVYKKALPQHKGSARYNHLRLKHNLQDRYERLRSGERVALYIDTNGEWFCFDAGNFPSEFAPEIDRREMFRKVVERPLSRFAVLAGYDIDNILSDTTQVTI